jgi:NitT/TauT family transport system ATP-binding protein
LQVTDWLDSVGPAKLAFEHVTKVYVATRGGRPAVAVQDFSLEVQENRFQCLLGPSGCGKSTLLNMAAGFDSPTSGAILVDGEPIVGAGADRGVVFQEYALFPWYTVLENVELGPRAHGVAVAERRELAEHYLGMVGLLEHRHKYPKELSGGMKQRVAIARTLANDPAIMLMDEPFGALDAQTRESLQDQLLEIWENTRKTVLFVTHSIQEAVVLSDAIALLESHPGRLVDVIHNDLPRPRSRTATNVLELEKEIYGRRYVPDAARAAG